MSKKLKILVIEDNHNDAILVERNLRRHSTTIVTTKKDGLLALGTGDFDVVLLDLNLVNGHRNTILGEINQCRGGAATVVLTGDINPATRDAMLALGADGFMVKGVDDKTQEDVEFVIYRALEHREGIT